MILPCARGEGEPRRFVQSISWEGATSRIHLAGVGGPLASSFHFSSEDQLRSRCTLLAARRVLFSVGGHAGWGPAEVMERWQDESLLPISFLKIAWSSPERWQVHEVAPGVKHWEVWSLDAILAADPVKLSDGVRSAG